MHVALEIYLRLPFGFFLLVVVPCVGGMKMKSFSCLMRQLDGLPLATGSSPHLFPEACLHSSISRCRITATDQLQLPAAGIRMDSIIVGQSGGKPQLEPAENGRQSVKL